MDVYRSFEIPIAVVQPGSVEELQEVVRVATGLGTAIVARGGGASYTDGYLPTTPKSITIDTSRLNKIVEINEEDMFVTVESGVTWAEMGSCISRKKSAYPILGAFFWVEGYGWRFFFSE